MNLFGNIRLFLIDTECSCTGSNAIVYENSIDNTTLQFILTKSGEYYVLPEHCNITVSFNGVECESQDVTIINRTQGRFNIRLHSNLFMTGNNQQYEISIKVYNFDDRKTFEYYNILDLKTSIFYSTGLDELKQVSEDYIFTNIKTENILNKDFCNFAKNYNNPEGYLVVEGYDNTDSSSPIENLPSKLLNSDKPNTYRVIE